MAALHQYHEDKGHFPPASILGKDGDGGPPHSWRVEILPWLGEQHCMTSIASTKRGTVHHNKSLLSRFRNVFRCRQRAT